MPFVKGVSGNPYGRRGKPKDDIAVLEAIERRLRQPVGAPRGRSYADKLAAQIIDGATRHGVSLNGQKNAVKDFRELLSAEAMLREHRLKGETQRPALPWDDTPETPGERDTAVPVRETEDDARQRWVQALTLAPVDDEPQDENSPLNRARYALGNSGTSLGNSANYPLLHGSASPLLHAIKDTSPHQKTEQGADQGALHGTDALPGEQSTVHGNAVLSEQEAMARLRIIQGKASPLPLPAVFGQPRKRDLDPRLDYLRPKGLHDVWNMAQEQEQEPWVVVGQEPEPRPASAPYRLGSGSLPDGVSWDTLATLWETRSPERGVGEQG